MLIGGIIICFLLLVLGSPITVAFAAGSALGILIYMGMPLESVSHYFFQTLDKYTLVAIPFFILAGNLMARGGIAKAIIDAAKSILGQIRGGMGLVVILATAIFGAISGSNLAAAMTIGTMLIPRMTEAGYSRRFSAALVCMSAPLDALIPPSITAIIYGLVTEKSISKLFMSSLLPAIVCIILLAIPTLIISRQRGYVGRVSVDWHDRRIAFLRSIPVLVIIVGVLGAIYAGIATPTEAAALSCVACAVIGWLAYREINLAVLWRCIRDASRVSANIFFLIGATSLLAMLLVIGQIPQTFTQLMLSWGLTTTSFSLVAFLILFLLGFVLDPAPLILVSMPIFMPTMNALGVNYYVFYVLVVIMVGVAQSTPPCAIILYVVSNLAEENPFAVFIECLPWMAMLLLTGIVVIFIPFLSTYIPSLM